VISPADAVYEQRLQDNALKFHYADMEGCSFINTGRSVQLVVPAGKCCKAQLLNKSLGIWSDIELMISNHKNNATALVYGHQLCKKSYSDCTNNIIIARFTVLF